MILVDQWGKRKNGVIGAGSGLHGACSYSTFSVKPLLDKLYNSGGKAMVTGFP